MVTMLPAPGIGPAGEGSSRPATGTSSTLGEAMRAPSTTTPEVVVLDDFPAELARREVLDPREDLWLSTSDGYVCLVSLPVVGSCAGSVPAAVPTLRMARGSIAWDRLPPLHCVDRFPSPIPVLTCAQPLLLPDHPSQGRCRPLLRDVLRKSRCPSSPASAPALTASQVHKDILVKTTFFKKALCGNFKESETQSIDLPEEDPAIFHFIIAFLYEGRYDPIKPIASALCL